MLQFIGKTTNASTDFVIYIINITTLRQIPISSPAVCLTNM